jgi:multisite-specific tRNA:(cytosine-C5)-methyltransferase
LCFREQIHAPTPISRLHSKVQQTAQLLEALHAHDTATSTSMPPGVLIANDSDNKRTHLLIHQSARLPSPALMVTNLDASIYPIIRVPVPNRRNPDGTQPLEQFLFDRILCDVPCSGDGTLRKNIGIWKNWQPMDGNGLHRCQRFSSCKETLFADLLIANLACSFEFSNGR